MSLHRPHLGRAGQGAGRERRDEHVEAVLVRADVADHGGLQVHDVAVALDLHELDHLDVPGSQTRPQVVAAEVDEHHVLGPLLGVGEQVLGQRCVVLRGLAARPGAGDRVGDRPAVRSP